MAAPFTGVTGGCVYGAVRYECSVEPVMTANCHCRDCQKASGGAYVSALAVPRNAVSITDDVKYFDVKGDNGNIVSRGFCPTCGARLFSKPAVVPDLLVITVGTLDDSSWFRPTLDCYTESAQPWDYMNPELAKFSKMPPMS